ncbi:Mitogen-activated protein kinase kinase [Quillaja saponaria]|uniref:Mitogen-activated protein kinase kinase n=1 Tax=Quillaja saponaria TaxID=32244 RepID=A0AAD7LR25_QUISA|nr:Mitogen-activated protein kinase kinase [Quillaja saponaria]
MKKRSREQNQELHFEEERRLYAYGRQWLRGPILGCGSFGTVSLAAVNKPRLEFEYMAVKSAELCVSAELLKEKMILNDLSGCPFVLRCFGEDFTITDKYAMVYNVFLEFASGGTLADLIETYGGSGLPESVVRCFTESIIRGLTYIHEKGYVHCDIKPENILLVQNSTCSSSASTGFTAKIGDFGLSKKAEAGSFKSRLRGTKMYLSPEAMNDKIQQQPADIWALGCVVLKMLTAKPPWELKDGNLDFHESPVIPSFISNEGKKFLRRCFERKPEKRFTADMLLNHPFISGSIFKDRDQEQLGRSILSLSEDTASEGCHSFSDGCSFIPLEESYSLSSFTEVEDIQQDIFPRFTQAISSAMGSQPQALAILGAAY